MDYETIELEIKDQVAIIRLNRPDVKNALNTQMRAEVTQCVSQMGKEARVVVITGSGSAFCSGQDLGDRKSVSQIDLERTLRDEYEPMLRSILDCPVPTIAAINGAAAGAGANLALAADVVIACDSAYFLQAFARIGLIPDGGATYLLPRLVGWGRAMELSLLAERLPAATAQEWGLVNRVFADTEALAAGSMELAQRLANGPRSLALIRKAYWQSWGNSYEQQLELEAQLQNEAGRSSDFREGVSAFLQKRDAAFKGK